jgi:hypothetical protein
VEVFVRVRRTLSAAIVLVSSASLVLAAEKKGSEKEKEPPSLSKLYSAAEFRSIGPYRGGRVTAVAGVRGRPLVFYFGGTGAGVWKTVDGGSNWQPVSDKDFHTGSVGAVAVSESDPNVVYAGTGESPIRGNVSNGDGVYKSTDGGKTWTNVGLDITRSRSQVHRRVESSTSRHRVTCGGPIPGAGSRSQDGEKLERGPVCQFRPAPYLVMMREPRILYAHSGKSTTNPGRRIEWAGRRHLAVVRRRRHLKKLAGGLRRVVGNIGVVVTVAP